MTIFNAIKYVNHNRVIHDRVFFRTDVNVVVISCSISYSINALIYCTSFITRNCTNTSTVCSCSHNQWTECSCFNCLYFTISNLCATFRICSVITINCHIITSNSTYKVIPPNSRTHYCIINVWIIVSNNTADIFCTINFVFIEHEPISKDLTANQMPFNNWTTEFARKVFEFVDTSNATNIWEAFCQDIKDNAINIIIKQHQLFIFYISNNYTSIFTSDTTKTCIFRTTFIKCFLNCNMFYHSWNFVVWRTWNIVFNYSSILSNNPTNCNYRAFEFIVWLDTYIWVIKDKRTIFDKPLILSCKQSNVVCIVIFYWNVDRTFKSNVSHFTSYNLK